MLFYTMRCVNLSITVTANEDGKLQKYHGPPRAHITRWKEDTPSTNRGGRDTPSTNQVGDQGVQLGA